jgi:hypothetical protein
MLQCEGNNNTSRRSRNCCAIRVEILPKRGVLNPFEPEAQELPRVLGFSVQLYKKRLLLIPSDLLGRDLLASGKADLCTGEHRNILTGNRKYAVSSCKRTENLLRFVMLYPHMRGI